MAAALYLLAFLWDLFRFGPVSNRPIAAVRQWKT
jgi:hypothetical protein